MKKLLVFIGLLIANDSIAQHLYDEQFQDCSLSQFCLDCGDIQAAPPKGLANEIIKNMNPNALKSINGQIEVQILINLEGKPCLLSAKNETNVKSKKLNLQSSINSTSHWSPALSKGKAMEVSVSLILNFINGTFSIQRRDFDFTKSTNFASVRTPHVKGSKEGKLTETWTVYNQQNSELPWDMSRTAMFDKEGNLWFGTDNGLVRMKDNKMEIFNSKNSSLNPPKYNINQTVSIRGAAVDNLNNKWLIGSWEVYKYDNKNWTVFDSLNSPIKWATKIYVDSTNNIWFTSGRGLIKYDGMKWSLIDTSNSEIPSNNISNIFIDSKGRTWIGTYDGNILIENNITTKFKDGSSPLEAASISQMYEDKHGDLWFDLYSKDKSKAGMFVLKTNGKWVSIKPEKSELFSKNDINHFLLDEETNILWIALNGVGLVRYDTTNDKWETYTVENSNIPTIHIMQLTKDANGIIWGATFAGIIKLNK